MAGLKFDEPVLPIPAVVQLPTATLMIFHNPTEGMAFCWTVGIIAGLIGWTVEQLFKRHGPR